MTQESIDQEIADRQASAPTAEQTQAHAINQMQPQTDEMDAAAEAAPPAGEVYTVQQGDSLSAIAERFYGDASGYTRIFEANRDKLENPDLIQPGQELVIPEYTPEGAEGESSQA